MATMIGSPIIEWVASALPRPVDDSVDPGGLNSTNRLELRECACVRWENTLPELYIKFDRSSPISIMDFSCTHTETLPRPGGLCGLLSQLYPAPFSGSHGGDGQSCSSEEVQC